MRKSLAELTTMRVGGDAADYVMADTTDELVGAVRTADASDVPVLIVGGGSNLVIGDGGFDGLVVHVKTRGVRIDGDDVCVEAGEDWDPFVATALQEGFGGLEPLSGVPGSVGGTPIQNVGAYGALVSQFLTAVTVYDRQTSEIREIPAADCGFGSHRQSIFKASDRYVVLRVQFTLPRTTTSRPLAYAGLAERLGVKVGDVAPTQLVRDTVLVMRRERGMVLDAEDHDTWSVGSFFINPVLPAVPDKARDCPTYPDVAGTKLPAAWLIHQAGFAPGYGADWGRGRVRLSSKHALAVTNRGGATTAELMAFAAHIREGVERAFDVRLGPECDLVNCSFDDPAPDWLQDLIPTGG
ncbi:UDP-N-acetylmuramate dehydrogenase [Mycolicibacterium llatzerense]|uniref:UDP-N-acetylmuramate dehydrogenase n=1 Tax=Mycolicibacterium llatzerense TaxID=280871 RepID=UPI0009F7343D|nr:UDP-N-acetylmuramate dehydrogenase [Mycolicibacterium llatzerense]